MPEQEFKEWYDWVKEKTHAYQDVESRTAIIAGFFEAKHKEAFTGHQISQIMALRYPEKE